ncbi:hypothetical protein VP01_4576g1, partial [Puccinia sorghi]
GPAMELHIKTVFIAGILDDARMCSCLQFERATADAKFKRVLKTMTLDNVREKSCALSKLASSSPCIMFNAALNPIQTYDKLIACVIECLSYLNLFALDVLSYSIVEFLSNPNNKDRSNLSLDPAIALQYIANQLAFVNAKDLIILRDMISKMAGADVLQDLSASQVVALGGLKTLRAEAISPTSLTVKKPSFSKSSNRLMKALTESGLTVPLLLLVTLQQQNAVLLADEGRISILFQYIEFLRIQLASRSISDHEKALPPMELMWEQYQNDPAIVFQVWGPLFPASVRPALKIGDDGEVKIDRNLASAALPSLTDKCVEPGIVLLAEKILPGQTRKLVGSVASLHSTQTPHSTNLNRCNKKSPHFFVTLWQLELYDIRMPDEKYVSETNRLNGMSYTRARLASEKSCWFPRKIDIYPFQLTCYQITHTLCLVSARSAFRAQLLEHIIQHCFNPRAKISPVDAAYAAQFIKNLHGLGTAPFITLKLLDRIFSSDVGPSIFPCSEFEASNYGRFLKDLFLLVKSWYDSESIFKKTGLGKDKRGNYLPGLRMKWVKSDNASEAIAESDVLSYENLQKVVK